MQDSVVLAIAIAIAAVCVYVYWGKDISVQGYGSLSQTSKFLSKAEVAAASGDSEKLLVCIIGHCYDVSKGRGFYGGDGGYSFFAGRDAARAYATGDFENDLTDDLTDFDTAQCEAVIHWYNFYKNSEKYTFEGYLEGSQYINAAAFIDSNDSNEDNIWSDVGIALFQCAKENEDITEKKEQQNIGYKTCNNAIDVQEKVANVWCDTTVIVDSARANDQEKHTIMVPRKMYYRDTSKTINNNDNKPPPNTSVKCVCVALEEAQKRQDLSTYPDCESTSSRCSYTV